MINGLGCFLADGITVLAIFEQNNAEDYINTLETYVLPNAYAFYGENFKFMQNDASIHTTCIRSE